MWALTGFSGPDRESQLRPNGPVLTLALIFARRRLPLTVARRPMAVDGAEIFPVPCVERSAEREFR
jgi:hypothetical protein